QDLHVPEGDDRRGERHGRRVLLAPVRARRLSGARRAGECPRAPLRPAQRRLRPGGRVMAVGLFFGGNDERPLARPDEVLRFPGQERRWKPRCSAYETAHSWFAAQDVPPAIRATLEGDPVYTDARLRKAVFEKKTAIDDLPRGLSQTDVLAFLEIKSG